MAHPLRRTACLAVAACLAAANVRAAESRPNIVVIVADDLGYGDLSVNGCKDIPTPNIDSLAANGVRCSNGYVSGPYCSPTRAGLMTGRYQERFGHEFNFSPPSVQPGEIGLSLKENPMPARLKGAGYVTGMVGKWHLGYADKLQPQARGFDEFYGFWGGSHDYLKPLDDQENPIVRGKERIDEKAYLTDAFGREAVAFVERHKQDPFFLYLPFNAVHSPMQTTEKYASRFPKITDEKRRTYAGMLSAMDDAIGGLLKKLEQEQLIENTLIFFISDNGGPETNNASDNGPFRGQKAQTWEGGIHVPFLVQWKGHLPAGQVYEQPVIQLDILPTVLAAIGAPASAGDQLDGVNLLPCLEGKDAKAPHDALYWRFGGQLAIRMGDWKLVKAPAEQGARASVGVATTDGAMLFNLKEDIGEQHDLASTETAKFQQLKGTWDGWNKELAPPAWEPRTNPKRKAAQ